MPSVGTHMPIKTDLGRYLFQVRILRNILNRRSCAGVTMFNCSILENAHSAPQSCSASKSFYYYLFYRHYYVVLYRAISNLVRVIVRNIIIQFIYNNIYVVFPLGLCY